MKWYDWVIPKAWLESEAAVELTDHAIRPIDAEVHAPRLDQVLRVVRDVVVQQAVQEGGPDLNTTMQLVVDCRDDDLFRRVLEVKGKLVVEVTAIPDLSDDGQLSQRMALLRAQAGVTEHAGV